ncbi:GNAT family N-acetyltransferase [Sediminivirga luteola]|uniref:GNAT family N-acetyltransferase n=1 Tax=Sediminivirga luteola TaxID=1774748 RepID=UPI001F5A4709|nr:GNAT family N-acetyltransferase [Sediminivirga luteola]MCI2263952.1 GNAT family N-acetyltransferase [Sediminivirga luteola]
MNAQPVVRQAESAESEHVIAACLDVFLDEAVFCWAVPDEALRRELAPALFAEQLRGALELGRIVVAEFPGGGIAGVSIWVTSEDADEAEETAAALQEQDSPELKRFARVAEISARLRPAERHVYLNSMAVSPQHRGAGVGAAMLRYGMDLARRLGLPLHLEASTPDSERFYARHGFQPDGEAVTLPDEGPTLQPMSWQPG